MTTNEKAATATVIAAGLLSSIGYASLVRIDAISGPRPVMTFVATLAVLFLLYAVASIAARQLTDSTPRLLVIVLGAVAFRAICMTGGLPATMPPSERIGALRDDLAGAGELRFERFVMYDHDLWRYLWDGHVQRHTGNAYAHAPEAPQLDRLASEEEGREWSRIRSYVNHGHIATIYPPAAQAVFFIAHELSPGSVTALKLCVVALDLTAMLFIALSLRAAGRPMLLCVLYGWNPLVVKVFAGSAHVDALVVCALAGTLYFSLKRRHSFAALAFTVAALAKLAPFILFPLLIRRIGWRRAAIAFTLIATGLLPMLANHSGLTTFARDWEFNAAPFYAVRAVLGSVFADADSVARLVCAAAAAGVAFYCATRRTLDDMGFATAAAYTIAAAVVLSPAVMPWYVTWILPFAVVSGRGEWLSFSGAVCAAFFVMIDGFERPWILALEYGLLVFCLALALRGRRVRLQWPSGRTASVVPKSFQAFQRRSI